MSTVAKTQIGAPEIPNLELTVPMQLVITDILSGKTISEACDFAGIPRRTYYRWMNGAAPQFVFELNNQRAEMVASIRSSVQVLAVSAVSTLAGIMSDDKAPTGARVRAAIAVLNQMSRQQSNESDRPLNRQIGTFLREMMR